ncbi:carbohydrate porin [Acinetobacter sp. ANC 4173]|uniref:carbohydrate porin n=1 Tax=Acinetobacter sp. ANC 4173 TaxID=2529837 RepID=UPI00103F4705|nr:carbohydrate porin [Acinetobacter sp. ANC 4173]TCB73337.1 porin [Acinetobacter sp. ANC 4173]
MKRTIFLAILFLNSSIIYAGIEEDTDTKYLTNGSIDFMDLALWANNSSEGNFFNSANLAFKTNAYFQDINLPIPGYINFTYTLFGLANDNQLDTSTNWMGGVGSYVPGAIAMNDVTSNQLSNLTWEAKWLDNSLETVIGRVSPRRFFYYNICSMAALCVDPVKTATGSPPSPYGYWAAYTKYLISDHWYIHGGAFEVNTSDYPEEKHGLDFSFNHNAGENYIYSLGYKFDDERGQTELTYSDNNAQYKNAYSGEYYDGIKTYNARFNYKFDEEKKYEIAGSYSYIDQKNWAYKSSWELDLNCKECLFHRKFGFRVGQTQLNNDFYEYTKTLNGNKNKTTTFVSADTEFKFKYYSISPFIEYIWNPDNYYKGQGESFDQNFIIGALFKARLYQF